LKKLLKALNDAKVLLIISLIIILALTSFLYSMNSQSDVKNNGLGIILIDTNIGMKSITYYENSFKKILNFKNIGITNFKTSSAADYVASIENYDVYKYIAGLVEQDNIDLIIMPEGYINELAQKNILQPIPDNLVAKISLENIQKCSYNGIIYAFPLLNKPVTPNDDVWTDDTQQPLFAAIYINGDNAQKAQEYIDYISSK